MKIIESSPKRSIFGRWVFWHFMETTKGFSDGWKNFLVSNFSYFSTVALLKSLFAPWRQDKLSYGKGFDPGRYLNVFLSNMISRILGAIVRIFMIAFGLVVEVLIFVVGLVVIVLWLLLPVLLIGGIFYGIGLLL